MDDAMTIPVLPCVSLDETLAFYARLGFEVTHRQTRPNVYVAMRWRDAHLHFMGIQGIDTANAFSTCLVLVPEVEELHRTFAAALRADLGKVPITGVPRISRMKPGQGRFTLVDVAGNSLIFIRKDAPDAPDANDAPDDAGPRSGTRLGKALRTAARLRDFKNDDRAAAKVLDTALAREPGASLDRARALIARLELTVPLDESARAESLRDELGAMSLPAAERALLQPALDAVDALVRSQR